MDAVVSEAGVVVAGRGGGADLRPVAEHGVAGGTVTGLQSRCGAARVGEAARASAGIAGGVVSTVTTVAGEGSERLPAASIAISR